jgi:hypothetical protein
MPIYALGDMIPELADREQVWIAPDAHVIGRSNLGAMSASGSARSSAAMLN